MLAEIHLHGRGGPPPAPREGDAPAGEGRARAEHAPRQHSQPEQGGPPDPQVHWELWEGGTIYHNPGVDRGQAAREVGKVLGGRRR